jgi:multidrug efflux pump subunit AcrA (membrane-fusion protein)
MLSKTVPNALVVPAAAVLTAPDGTATVMVAGADNHAHQRTVKTGIRHGDDVQIVEGLKDGEKVVVAGAYGLPDNTKIIVEAPKESAQGGDKPAGKESDKDEK